MRHRVGIRELRDSLSRWIERAKSGDEIIVTDHGRDVASLSRVRGPGPSRTWKAHVARLRERGLLVGGGGVLPTLDLGDGPDVDLSQAILDDREERERSVADFDP